MNYGRRTNYAPLDANDYPNPDEHINARNLFLRDRVFIQSSLKRWTVICLAHMRTRIVS